MHCLSNGEYGVNNLYAGVPVIIGKNDVEKIVEISGNLNIFGFYIVIGFPLEFPMEAL